MRRILNLASAALAIGLVLAMAEPGGSTNLKDIHTRLFDKGNVVLGTNLGSQIVGAQSVDTGLRDAVIQVFDNVANVNSQIPVPSASASFSYEFDSDLDLFVRRAESLGPIFADRALTLGRGRLLISTAYTHVSFDRLNGRPLNGFSQQTQVGQEFIQSRGNQLPGIADDYVELSFPSFDVTVDNIAFFATYGLTDRIDVGVGVPLVRVAVKGTVKAEIVDPNGDSGPPGSLNRLQICRTETDGACERQGLIDPSLQSVSDTFDEYSFGLGDPLLRGKYRFLETSYADVAGVVTMTIPGGGADDLRGYNDVTGTPVLVVSKGFGFISPHLNAGYSFRSKQDVPQAVWAAGAELRVMPWLTVLPDFLGFVQTDGPRNEVYQFSLGFKVNPYKDFVLGANFQLPLNDQGLRANVIYTGMIEYTF